MGPFFTQKRATSPSAILFFISHALAPCQRIRPLGLRKERALALVLVGRRGREARGRYILSTRSLYLRLQVQSTQPYRCVLE